MGVVRKIEMSFVDYGGRNDLWLPNLARMRNHQCALVEEEQKIL
jgi:hypothetical protein